MLLVGLIMSGRILVVVERFKVKSQGVTGDLFSCAPIDPPVLTYRGSHGGAIHNSLDIHGRIELQID